MGAFPGTFERNGVLIMELIDQKISSLREELRNGRQANRASENTNSDGGNDDRAHGTNFQGANRAIQNIAGNIAEAGNNNRQIGSDRRGPEKKSVGQRSADRRSGENHSSTAENVPAGSGERTIGRLFTDDPIKERLEPRLPGPAANLEKEEKRPVGRPRKDGLPAGSVPAPSATPGAVQQKIEQIVSGGEKLSQKEADEMKTSLLEALGDHFDSLDKYLWNRQKSAGKESHDQPIWSDLDQEEIEKLTKLMIRWGRHNATAAAVARATVDSADYVACATIFAPRIHQTVKIMRETRIPRKKRGEA